MKIAASCLFNAALAVSANTVLAASHDQFIGDGIKSHYVALTGHSGDNEINRKNLQAAYEACLRLSQTSGKSAKINESLPDIVTKINVEIYYAINRTLEIQNSEAHSVSTTGCAIEGLPAKTWTLRSSAGICRIDLLKKSATGMCDTKAHENARNVGLTAANKTMPSVDLSKVPPQVRQQVEAAIKAHSSSAGGNSAWAGYTETMQSMTIAGKTCLGFRNSAMNQEQCMAKLDANIAAKPNPQTVFTMGLNGGLEGILLQLKSPALTLSAQKVDLNLSLVPGFFGLPAGIQLNKQGSPK